MEKSSSIPFHSMPCKRVLPRKIFENFDTVVGLVAILLLFEQFSGKFCAPNSECFIKCDAFCSYILDYTYLERKAYLLSKRFEIMEKLYLSKTCSKMAGGGMHPSHPVV